MNRIVASLCAVVISATMLAQQQHADFSKLSPLVRHATTRTNATLTAFVQTADNSTAEQVLHQTGCRILAQQDDIAIVSIPLHQIGTLSRHPAILRIEAGRSAQTLMDTVPRLSNILPAYTATQQHQAYTGQGVVLGLMDIGFDLTHPTFYSVNGMERYRISAFWDQLSPDSIGSPLPVGRDYVGTDAVLACRRSTDAATESHGTHTLGIAAGSGFNSNYRGVAFESDICLVSNAVTSDTIYIQPDDYYKYTTATDALGFQYLFDYAQRQGKPCVASFSEGYDTGLSTEDSLYAAYLSKLEGPGRIIVVAAGNENCEQTYMAKAQGTSRAGAFIRCFRQDAQYRLKTDGPIRLQLIAYDETNPVQTLTITSDDGRLDSLLTDTLFLAGDTCAVSLSRYPSAFTTGETVYQLQLWGNQKLSRLLPLALVVEGTDSHVEVWGNSLNALTSRSNDPQWHDAQYGHNILGPSSFPTVISVGATAHRLRFTNYRGEQRDYADGQEAGRRMTASSTGPTLTGLTKPDVAAPGYNVISSYSSYFIEAHGDGEGLDNDVAHFDVQGRTYGWNASSGTSMACPVVAGTIALWLQANPLLTRQDVLGVFSRTCTHPDATLQYPNNEYGYGEIDAYAGLLDILGLPTTLPQLSRHQPHGVTFRLVGRTLYIDGMTAQADNTTNSQCIPAVNTTNSQCIPAEVTIYDLSGRPVLKADASNGMVNLSSLSEGVYAVQLANLGSTLIRL